MNKVLLILRFLLLLCCTLWYSVTYSQNYRSKGDRAWAEGKIKTAINNYNLVENIDRDKQLIFKRGLAYFKINSLNNAIKDFTQAKKLGNSDPQLFWLMAQAKHHLGDYEEATFFYKEYVKQVGENSAEGFRALRELKNCTFAAIDQKQDTKAYVQSFGEEVNSYYDEIFPVQSPRFGNIFYFSSNESLKDMEVYSYALQQDGTWAEDESFVTGINASGDDYVMDVSANGRSLIFVRIDTEKKQYRIYVSTFDQNDQQHIFELPADKMQGAIDLQIQDYNTIAFASNQLGGEGGYDIFTIEYNEGKWSKPANVGPVINTEYDERSPFIASNGDFIYFSSNKPYCYGGYDVYYYNTYSLNDSPVNMGRPVNSAGDDLQFRLNEDGQMGVFSSNRKVGIGAYDIYMAYMKIPKPTPVKDTLQLAYVADYLSFVEKQAKGPVTHLDRLKEKVGEEPSNVEDEQLEDNQVMQEQDTIGVEEQVQSPIADILNGKETIDENKDLTIDEPESPIVGDTISSTVPIAQEAVIEEIDPDSFESSLTYLDSRELKYSLLYKSTEDVLKLENKFKLNAISDLLRQNEDFKVRVLANTDDKELGLPEFMQYNTLKRAKLVTDYLLENGVNAEQISIESLSNNYPIAKAKVSGKDNKEYVALNRRINIEIKDASGSTLQSQEVKDYKLPGFAQDRRYELFSQIREEVYYSVEIGSSKKIFKNAVLRLYDDIYIRKEYPTAENKYYVGIYTQYEDVKKLYQDLSDSSAPYAKIVAFYNGNILNSSTIDMLSDQYPHLKVYSEEGLSTKE